MKKHEYLIIADYSQKTPLTFKELCDICQISSDFLNMLMEYDIIHPRESEQEEWLFDLTELKRIQRAMRLQRDLEVNLAGVAVMLDLLEELEELRAQIEFMQKHYL